MPPKSKAAAAAAAEPVAVEDLFTALHRHIQAGEFPQAVKVADQAPEDEDAVRCKVVAHIKSDATDKALATIRAAERLPIDLSYYKAAAAAPAPAAKEKKAKGKDKEGFKTIEMTEKLNCRSKDIYEILMDENRWKGFTQSNARISREVGGQFNLFDGSITGINEELQEGKVIMQKWRFGSWPGGFTDAQRDILVRLVFDEPESGVTIIKLKQTDVPEEDRYGNSTVVENTERGWRELIFQRIRAVFGFGI